MMTKKDFIALADKIRDHNSRRKYVEHLFADELLVELAEFCASRNPRSNRERWLNYIAGRCGPCGGSIRKRQVRAEVEAEADD